MKNILVFGTSGMAGHMITLYLSKLTQKYNVIGVCHKNKFNEKDIICDISNINMINNLIENSNLDIIINCVGVLNKNAEKDIKNTVYINTFFPKFLERIAQIRNIKIIHLSTDCVFDGKKGNYTETSFKNENSIYGLSKNLGEIYSKNALTIRTSIIGPELKHGSGLFHWFMHQHGTIKGYSNVYWTGITTLELAKAIDKAIDENIYGLYHIVPSKKISKYDLLNILKKEFNRFDINIQNDDTYVSDKSLIRSSDNFSFEVSSYEDMIHELNTWMISNKEIYTLYYQNN